MRENCTYGSWRSLSPTVYIIRKGEKFTHEMVLLLVLCGTFSFVWIDSCNDVEVKNG